MSVAIVGNGKHVSCDGIDHCTVIRMGNFQISGYEDCVGTRTDMIANGISVLKLWRYIDPDTDYDVPIWVMVPNIDTAIIGTSYETSYCHAWRSIMFGGRQPSQDEHLDKLKTLKQNNEVFQISWSDVIRYTNQLSFERLNIPIEDQMIRPTLGFSVTSQALQKYSDVQLYGFDFFSTGVYWDDQHKHAHTKHSILLEKLTLKSWHRGNKIILK